MHTDLSVSLSLDMALAHAKPPFHGTGTNYTLYLKIQECQDLASQDVFNADRLIELMNQAIGMCDVSNCYTRWILEDIISDLNEDNS